MNPSPNLTAPFAEIVTEEQVADLAKKVIEKISKGVTEAIGTEAYMLVEMYLNEHFENFENRMFEQAFKFINGDRWSKFKDKYNAADFRALIYKEHKEELDKMITDQIVEENIHLYLGHFFADSHKTGWKYRPMEPLIYKWVIARYPDSEQLRTLITDEAVKENMRLKDQVEHLKKRLEEIGNLV